MNIGLAPPCTRPEQKTLDSCVSEGALIALKVSSKKYSETKSYRTNKLEYFEVTQGLAKNPPLTIIKKHLLQCHIKNQYNYYFI